MHTNSAELPSLAYFAAAQGRGALKRDYETCETQQGVAKVMNRRDEVIAYEDTLVRHSAYSGLARTPNK